MCVAARIPAVIVMPVDKLPAERRLALNVRGAGVELRLQQIELLFKSVLGGLARVDRAPLRQYALLVHFFTPKKTSPFQWVPVIALATAVSDLYFLPSNSTVVSSTTNPS